VFLCIYLEFKILFPFVVYVLIGYSGALLPDQVCQSLALAFGLRIVDLYYRDNFSMYTRLEVIVTVLAILANVIRKSFHRVALLLKKIHDTITGNHVMTYETEMSNLHLLDENIDKFQILLIANSRDRLTPPRLVETLLDVDERLDKFILSKKVDIFPLSPLRSVFSAPDAVIVGCKDGDIAIVNIETRRFLLFFDKHTKDVTSLDLSKDGKKLVSGSADKTFRVWNVDAYTCAAVSPVLSGKINVVKFTADAAHVLVGSGEDKSIKMYSVVESSVSLVREFKGHTRKVTSIDTFADGNRFISVSPDETVLLWNIKTGKGKHVFVDDFSIPNPAIGETTEIDDFKHFKYVTISPDQTMAATCERNGHAETWKIDTGVPLYMHSGKRESVGVAFSPSGAQLIVASNSGIIDVFDTISTSDAPVKRFEKFMNPSDKLSSLAVSRDGVKLAVTGKDGVIYVFSSINTMLTNFNLLQVSQANARGLGREGTLPAPAFKLIGGYNRAVIEGSSSGGEDDDDD
jgi:WD40 repeat protein